MAPTAPRSPAATPGNASVKLTWLAPSSNGGAPIDKYYVQRSLVAGAPWTTVTTTTALSATATGLTNGTHYYFRIVAHNATGFSPSSTIVNAVPHTAPTAPRSPAATPGNASVKLTWLAPSSNGGAPIDKYYVQRSLVAGAPWTTVTTTTALSATATGLTNGTHYYFRIVAHNATGFSPSSTIVNAVPRTVPTAPRSPAVTPGNQSFFLSWTAPLSNGGAAVTGYVVEYFANGQWYFVGPSATTTFSVSSGNFVNGTTYYFRIRAKNAVGSSVPSTVVSAVPRTVPGTVPYCHAEQASFGSDWMVFSWKPSLSDGGAPISHYEITIYKNGVEYNFTSVANGPNYVATLMAPIYGGYDVRIRAINTAGFGAACWTTAFMYF